MDWWKELAKSCLNVGVATIVVFIYGTAVNPQFGWRILIWGLALVIWWGGLSYLFWKKGSKRQ